MGYDMKYVECDSENANEGSPIHLEVDVEDTETFLFTAQPPNIAFELNALDIDDSVPRTDNIDSDFPVLDIDDSVPRTDNIDSDFPALDIDDSVSRTRDVDFEEKYREIESHSETETRTVTRSISNAVCKLNGRDKNVRKTRVKGNTEPHGKRNILNWTKVMFIRRIRDSLGEASERIGTQKKLAKKYNVSNRTIVDVWNNNTWSNTRGVAFDLSNGKVVSRQQNGTYLIEENIDVGEIYRSLKFIKGGGTLLD